MTDARSEESSDLHVADASSALVLQPLPPSRAEATNPWPIAGHASAVATMRFALAAQRIAHAYLLTGPEGIGRSTLARLFASALVCTAGQTDALPTVACGTCAACRKVSRGVHPDVEILSLAGQQAVSEARGARNRNITIDSVRGLRDRLILRPLEARWRVAIIEDAETMSGGGGLPAASALLKTLEEPPPFAVLILIAPDADAVLPTLRSRCQLLALGPVGRDDTARYLVEHRGASPDDAALLAALAQGRPGWAVLAQADPEQRAQHETNLQSALSLIEADPLRRLQGIDDLAARFGKADWRAAEAELDLLIGIWRDLLLLRSDCADLVVHRPIEAELRVLADRFALAEAARAVAASRTAALHVRQNVSVRLALEAMVLAWPSLAT